MTSTEVAIVMPAMLIVILFVFQIALFWHAKQAADVAAEEAVDAAQVANATEADGYAGANTILQPLSHASTHRMPNPINVATPRYSVHRD